MRRWVALMGVLACTSSGGDLPDIGGVDAGLDASCGTERCNERDDDCDGRIDEGLGLESDPLNCGSCGYVCDLATGSTGVNVCERGGCAVDACEDGRFNCDHDPGNACESELVELENCGECGLRCELFGAEATCATGACAIDDCRTNHEDCDRRIENGCEVDRDTDIYHCGECGRLCPAEPPNAAPACESGNCALDCDPGFGDCNGDPLDGCEQELSAISACGACDRECEAGELCSGDAIFGFTCIPPPCIDPPTRCGDSCVDTETSPLHCGGCDLRCGVPSNANATCADARCGFACDLTFADCDHDFSNGCEVRVTSDPNHCGACDNVCDSGLCVEGRCIGGGGMDAGMEDAGVAMDAGLDAGVDSGFDAGFDAARDAGFDAARDAGFDAGRDAGGTILDAAHRDGAVRLDSGWPDATISPICRLGMLGESRYAICSAASWSNAKAECEGMGMHLLTIDSNEENVFLAGLLTGPSWTGLNDRVAEGEFRWLDGTAMSFTAWAPGQPDGGSADEDCMVLDTNRLWYDRRCEAFLLPYICESP